MADWPIYMDVAKARAHAQAGEPHSGPDWPHLTAAAAGRPGDPWPGGMPAAYVRDLLVGPGLE